MPPSRRAVSRRNGQRSSQSCSSQPPLYCGIWALATNFGWRPDLETLMPTAATVCEPDHSRRDFTLHARDLGALMETAYSGFGRNALPAAFFILTVAFLLRPRSPRCEL